MILLIIILLCAGLSPAQESNIEKYQFISPLPGSKLIMPENNIIIRQGDIIDATTIKEELIEVIGSISGLHSGEFFLSDDMRTLIFLPSIHFTKGEKVKVELKDGIYTTDGNILRGISFDFMIADSWINNTKQVFISSTEDLVSKINVSYDDKKIADSYKFTTGLQDSLPLDFPTFRITEYNNPSEGYLFLSPRPIQGILGYLTIVSNEGVPIFYRRMSRGCSDFKLNHNGLLTYYDYNPRKFIALDSSYFVVDSYAAGNGYGNTDLHELQILPNGHALLMTRDFHTVRMDTIVPGGDAAAVVIGQIIQELDETKNVIFQWRSWDHFKITDATEDIDLTAHTIDYVHGNSIEVDYDSHILLSSRHMDEITKIDRQTGEIIWRFGGIKSRNNQFLFTNDLRTFSHQHDIRRLPNGNITLFDNGNLLTPRYSSSLEYYLDEQNKTATLIWEYHEQSVYSYAMGSSRRLNDGHTLLGWGAILAPSVTEVSYDGTKTFELIYDSSYNYRAYRFPWKTNLFVTNPDSIFFESVSVGDSATISVDLINNSPDPIEITGYYNINEDYLVENPVPFTVPAFDNVSLEIKFKPSDDGYFKDYLHIRSDTETSRVAQVMILAGRTDTIFYEIEDEIIYNYVLEQNYPNPFNPSTIIRFSMPEESFVTIKVFNTLGEEITTLISENIIAGNYEVEFDASKLPSGIYFYKLQSETFIEAKKMVLMK